MSKSFGKKGESSFRASHGGDSTENTISEEVNIPSQEKPRHLEEETASYLLEIEAQFKGIVEGDQEAKEILVSNVLAEIQSRSASAACDRRTNFLFEQLCYYASPPQLIQLLQRWTNYSVFLARNRFASHIVQTVISRICFFFQQGSIYNDSDRSEVDEIIVQFSRVLLQEMFWLGKEMSASHVIRSLLCLLSGLPTIAEKKSKNSKHQHAVVFSEPLENMIAANDNAFFISADKAFAVPKAFTEEVLAGFRRLVVKKSKHDLQLFIADSSSAALLSLLLKIVANPKLYSSEVTLELFKVFLEKLFDSSILKPFSSSYSEKDGQSHSDSHSDSHSAAQSDVFYAMAGDKLGSFFLETVITVLPFEEIVLPIVDKNLLGAHSVINSSDNRANSDSGGGAVLLKEYCFDGFGNYVVQALIKRLHCEVLRVMVSQSQGEVEGEGEINHKEKGEGEKEGVVEGVARRVVQEMQRLKKEVEAKEWSHLLRQRRGIFYWLLELSLSLSSSCSSSRSSSSNSSSSSFLVIASFIVSGWLEEEKELKEKEGDASNDNSHDNSHSESVSVVVSDCEVTSETLRTIASTAQNPLLLTITQYIERKLTEKPPSPPSSSQPSSSSTNKKNKNKSKNKKDEKEEDGMSGEQLLLSKILRVFLLQSLSENLAAFFFQTILALSPSSMTTVINTSQLNKNLLDTILLSNTSHTNNTNPNPNTNPNSNNNNNRSHWTKLFSMKMAEDSYFPLFLHSFYGLKNLRAIFERCDNRGKEKWLSLLSSNSAVKVQLMKSKDGRNLIDITKIDLFIHDKKEWKATMKNETKHEQHQQHQPSSHANNKNSHSKSVKSSDSGDNSNNKRKREDSQSLLFVTGSDISKINTSQPDDSRNKRDEKQRNEEEEEKEEGEGGEGGEDDEGEKKKRKRKRQRKNKTTAETNNDNTTANNDKMDDGNED